MYLIKVIIIKHKLHFNEDKYTDIGVFLASGYFHN